MSQLVKTKRQANFKGFKRFGAFKGLVDQKNVVFNLLSYIRKFLRKKIIKLEKTNFITNKNESKTALVSTMADNKFRPANF
jgi:hypothetical protein